MNVTLEINLRDKTNNCLAIGIWEGNQAPTLEGMEFVNSILEGISNIDKLKWYDRGILESDLNNPSQIKAIKLLNSINAQTSNDPTDGIIFYKPEDIILNEDGSDYIIDINIDNLTVTFGAWDVTEWGMYLSENKIEAAEAKDIPVIKTFDFLEPMNLDQWNQIAKYIKDYSLGDSDCNELIVDYKDTKAVVNFYC